MSTRPGTPEDMAVRISGAARAKGRQRDCGHFDIRIGSDGTWHYHGTPITRKPLVRLFSTVLKRDGDGRYWLETPAERGLIDVDDAPFTAVALTVEGQGRDQRLTFRTNVDEIVIADGDHPIRIAVVPATGEPRPYVHVRGGLEALILRPVFYELAELAARGDDGRYGVWSVGAFFPLEGR